MKKFKLIHKTILNRDILILDDWHVTSKKRYFFYVKTHGTLNIVYKGSYVLTSVYLIISEYMFPIEAKDSFPKSISDKIQFYVQEVQSTDASGE